MYKYLDELEAEAIYIIREVASWMQNPVILFSGGKDSIVLTYLALKAFYPARVPFPIMHVDTGHNFQETIDFRDDFAKKYDLDLLVQYVQDSIDAGTVKEETWFHASRNALQTITLLEWLEKYKFDCALWWARRDEEKARAKERFFSHRDAFWQWDPKNQRPELFDLYNSNKNFWESFRVFPISNWTELDIWRYIKRESIELPSLYFTKIRKCFTRDGIIYGDNEYINKKPEEKVEEKTIRFRTIWDATCTWAVESKADNLNDIIKEIEQVKTTERGWRADDKRSDTAMEDRKKRWYF